MRLAATFISIFALLLSGCGLTPKSSFNSRAELNKLKGPDVTSIQTSLKEQAVQAESTGDYKLAAQNYKQLWDKEPENKEYTMALITDLRRSGDNDNALKIIDEVLKKDPNNAAALEAKGLSLMNAAEFTDAGKVFGDVMKIDGKRWRTLNGIGILFAMKSMDSEAESYYQASLEQSTDNPNVLNNLALTQAMEHQYDRSIETFERAKHHLPAGHPDIKHIDMNEALVYAIAGKLDEAEHVASTHLSKEALYNNMGFYSYLAKNNELAKGYLNMALTQSPVYYERAWKNLSAINGDNSEQGEKELADQAKSLETKIKKKSSKRDYAEPSLLSVEKPIVVPTPKPRSVSSKSPSSSNDDKNDLLILPTPNEPKLLPKVDIIPSSAQSVPTILDKIPENRSKSE
jgi:Flp pilus assembly protein TadD